MTTTMLRVAAVSAALLGLSMPALAQFSGVYAPANWTTSHVPDAPTDMGTVDISGAPGFITLNGSDASPGEPGPFSRLEFTIVAPAAGQVKFDWSYVSNDATGDPLWDPAGYRRPGDKDPLTQLSVNGVDGGSASQNGTKVSFNVTAGQTFGFYVSSEDNFGGNATLTISGFEVTPIPEPASVAMMALGLLGVATLAARRRRSN